MENAVDLEVQTKSIMSMVTTGAKYMDNYGLFNVNLPPIYCQS